MCSGSACRCNLPSEFARGGTCASLVHAHDISPTSPVTAAQLAEVFDKVRGGAMSLRAVSSRREMHSQGVTRGAPVRTAATAREMPSTTRSG